MRWTLTLVAVSLVWLAPRSAIAQDAESQLQQYRQQLQNWQEHLGNLDRELIRTNSQLDKDTRRHEVLKGEFDQVFRLQDAWVRLLKPLERIDEQIKQKEIEANGTSFWWSRTKGAPLWEQVKQLKKDKITKRQQISDDLKRNGTDVTGYTRDELRLTLEELGKFIQVRQDLVLPTVTEIQQLPAKIDEAKIRAPALLEEIEEAKTKIATLNTKIANLQSSMRADAAPPPMAPPVRYRGQMDPGTQRKFAEALAALAKSLGAAQTHSLQSSPVEMLVDFGARTALIQPVNLSMGVNMAGGTGDERHSMNAQTRMTISTSEATLDPNGNLNGGEVTFEAHFRGQLDGQPKETTRVNKGTWRAVPVDPSLRRYQIFFGNSTVPMFLVETSQAIPIRRQ